MLGLGGARVKITFSKHGHAAVIKLNGMLSRTDIHKNCYLCVMGPGPRVGYR